MPAPARKVNLLPPTEFEQSFWGKFLKWSITTGRYIVILTELVVIVAFLSRFKLDTEISELNSEIAGKKNVLDAQLSFEKDFKTIQSRLVVADTLMKTKLQAADKIDLVVKDVPAEVKLESLIVAREGITVKANTLSEQAMGQMLSQMSQSSSWRTVEIKKVTSNPLQGIEFELFLQ